MELIYLENEYKVKRISQCSLKKSQKVNFFTLLCCPSEIHQDDDGADTVAARRLHGQDLEVVLGLGAVARFGLRKDAKMTLAEPV